MLHDHATAQKTELGRKNLDRPRHYRGHLNDCASYRAGTPLILSPDLPRRATATNSTTHRRAKYRRSSSQTIIQFVYTGHIRRVLRRCSRSYSSRLADLSIRIKTSWGIVTLPCLASFFLPLFCFSSSFRFRGTSPP